MREKINDSNSPKSITLSESMLLRIDTDFPSKLPLQCERLSTTLYTLVNESDLVLIEALVRASS